MSPASWLKLPLKRVAEVMPSNVDKHTVEGELPVRLCNYVDVYNNDRIDDSIDFMAATASEAQITRFTLKAQDVLVTKDSEEPSDIGVPAYVPRDMPGVVCGYHLAVLRPDLMRVHGAFLHWALQSTEVQAYYETAATGISRYALGLNDLGMTPLHLPDRPTQARIANFLDEQTARIDALIAEKERLDGLLGEYRSSLITATVTGHVDVETGAMFPRAHEGGGGVSGRVVAPVAWSWSKLKHVASFYTGWTPPTGNAEFFDGDNLWANISDLGPKILHDTAKRISEKAIDNTAMRVSPAGSVLFSFKLSIGQISFAGRDMYTNEAIATFPPQAGFNTRWAYWALPIFLPLNADENIYGAKLLNQELMRSADILVPPLADQERIANFLDEQTARIDALREHCKEHIGLLREYRAALISAAVTGQLDIDNFGRQVA